MTPAWDFRPRPPCRRLLVPKQDRLLRFLAKVEVTEGSDCWMWTGATILSASGALYGQVNWRGDWQLVHRWAWIEFRGNGRGLSTRAEIHHTCGNTLCVNPFHLQRTGSRREHVRADRQRRAQQQKKAA